MGRQFPLNRGSHPQPPLYPPSQGVSGVSGGGGVVGIIELGSCTASLIELIVRAESNAETWMPVDVTLASFGCVFDDATTTQTFTLGAFDDSVPVVVVRPTSIRAEAARVVAIFTAPGRNGSAASIDVMPEMIDPETVGAVLYSDGTNWVRATEIVLEKVTADEVHTTTLNVGGDAVVLAVNASASLPADATDLASTMTLANAIKVLLGSAGL